MMEINNYSEPIPDYGKAIDGATSVDALRAAIEPFKLIANDALTVANAMLRSDWNDFKKGLKSERRGKFAGIPWTERYGAILLPTVMLMVGMTASKFMVPWGVAYIRHKEFGHIKEADGVATWNKP